MFSGKVVRTAEAINVQARTLRVEVDVPNPHNALVPGMYVTVAFGLPPRGSVEVPAAALLFRSGGPQVARVDAHGRVELKDVSIARDNGNEVELGSGVAPGDQLILNMSSQILAGQVVAPRGAGAGPAERLTQR
jgi:multidrug efflux pump subunit AcrA (membrane-fusion protein)